jgi:hypothetical protein
MGKGGMEVKGTGLGCVRGDLEKKEVKGGCIGEDEGNMEGREV